MTETEIIGNLTPLEWLRPLYNVCSIDLGQASDYTAISVATKYEKITKPVFGDEKTEGYETHVRYQTRFRQIPYPEIIARIKRIISKIPGEVQHPQVPLYVLVDVGGVGKPVYDELKKVFRAGTANIIGYMLTSGEITHFEGGIVHIPKKDIVGALIYVSEMGMLKLADKLETRDALAMEWDKFTRKRRESGTESFEGNNEHDDLIISLGFLAHFTLKNRGVYYSKFALNRPGSYYTGPNVPRGFERRNHDGTLFTEPSTKPAELVRMHVPGHADK